MVYEIISDNCCFLHPKTMLFAILMQPEHIGEDRAKIGAQEWSNMLTSFKNTGRPLVGFNMPNDAVSAWIKSQPYIECFDGVCTVDTRQIIGDFDYTREEREYLDSAIRVMGDQGQYKAYALFCRLDIDSRLLSDSSVVTLLHLRFFNISAGKSQEVKSLELNYRGDQQNE